MPRKLLAICLTLIIALAPAGALAAPEAEAPVELGNNIALLMEPGTQTVIYAQRESDRVPIASVTKIMTLLIAFDRIEAGLLSMEESVTISKNAAATQGSQAFLDAGSAYTVEQLIKTIIISSANDSSVALAEHIAGSEGTFVSLMNTKSYQLGMEDTRFETCTGLPADNQYSTASDVAIMATELLTRPQFFAYSNTWMDTLTHPGGRVTELTNTNRLVRFYTGADGLKTGYSTEAGYCLTATAAKNGTRYLVVLLGYEQSKARFDAAERLLDYAFDNYYVETVVEEGQVVKADVPVRGGSRRTVNLVARESVRILAKKGSDVGYTVTQSLPETLTAPILSQDKVGEIVITMADGTQKNCPVTIDGDADITTGLGGQIMKILSLWGF